MIQVPLPRIGVVVWRRLHRAGLKVLVGRGTGYGRSHPAPGDLWCCVRVHLDITHDLEIDPLIPIDSRTPDSRTTGTKMRTLSVAVASVVLLLQLQAAWGFLVPSVPRRSAARQTTAMAAEPQQDGALGLMSAMDCLLAALLCSALC